jgi:hypothetical protein
MTASRGRFYVFVLGLLLQNGHAGLDNRVDWISAISPMEKREINRSCRRGIWLGRAVGGQHNLFTRFVQGVKGMEKLFLSIFFAFDELNVIHQQHIGTCSIVGSRNPCILSLRIAVIRSLVNCSVDT